MIKTTTRIRCLILTSDGSIEEVTLGYEPQVGDAFPGCQKVAWVIVDRSAILVRLVSTR